MFYDLFLTKFKRSIVGRQERTNMTFLKFWSQISIDQNFGLVITHFSEPRRIWCGWADVALLVTKWNHHKFHSPVHQSSLHGPGPIPIFFIEMVWFIWADALFCQKHAHLRIGPLENKYNIIQYFIYFISVTHHMKYNTSSIDSSTHQGSRPNKCTAKWF